MEGTSDREMLVAFETSPVSDGLVAAATSFVNVTSFLTAVLGVSPVKLIAGMVDP